MVTKNKVVFWKGLKAVILYSQGPNAKIKIIDEKGKGNTYEVPFSELNSDKPKTINYSFSGCPNCGLKSPSYRDGLECPSCFHMESLSFKKWIISEMGHIEVMGKIDGKEIAVIDPMFEKYPKNTWNPDQAINHIFWGKLPHENKYLVYRINHKTGNTADIEKTHPRIGYQLPNDWWDYAEVLYADNSVKMPIKP